MLRRLFGLILAVCVAWNVTCALTLAQNTEALDIGAEAPHFEEVSLNGQPLRSSVLQGHSHLLWFTNFSDGAMGSAPTLIAAVRGRPGVDLLVVSLNGSSESRARSFAERYALVDNVVLDSDGSTVRAFTGSFIEGGTPLYNLFALDLHARIIGRYHFPGIPPRVLEQEMKRL